MLSPRALGTVTHIAEKGSYAVDVSAILTGHSLLELMFGDRTS